MNAHLARAARAAEQATSAAAHRDALIIAASNEGHSLREIAEATGISHTTVATIVRKATP